MTTDNSYHIGRYTLWQPLLWVRQFFWLFPLGASFLSCTVGKNYQQPTLDMPDSFRYAPGKDTSGLGKMSWADFFQDPVLRDLIDSGIHHNYDLELAINNMDRSRQLLLQSKAGNQPQAYLQFGVTSDIPSKNSLNGLSTNQFLGTYHVEDYNASLNISWEADIWGKIRRRKQAALADYMASWEARKAVQTQLVADIASAYYNLLMLDAQLNVAKRSVALDDSTLRIIRLEFKAGQANALAVEQANAQRDAAALLVPQIEQASIIQENALRILLASFPAPVARRATLDSYPVPDAYSTGVPLQLVSIRPDIRSSEFMLQAANARVGVAKANMYPSLVITASGGFDAYLFSNWFALPASLFGQALGSLTQPLLQQRQLKTQYNLAELNRQTSLVEFRKTMLVAVREVSDALVKIAKLKTQQTIAQARADTLQNATRNASFLYRSGMANYLEVITAQATALQSQLQIVDIKRQQLGARVELYRSLGGGWQ